jgi:RNA polymerase sigma factor (sigma-70 family)
MPCSSVGAGDRARQSKALACRKSFRVIDLRAASRVLAHVMKDRDLDSALVSGIHAEDVVAEEAFVRTHGPRVEWIIQASGVPSRDCKDVAQEVLIAAMGQIRRGLFRGDSSLGTWLGAIVRGKVIDYRRSRARACLPSGYEGCQEVVLASDMLEDALVHRSELDLVLTVRQVLHRMPRRHRAILILNKTAGFTINELARRLGLPPGTVGRILAEAKTMFRQILTEGEEFSVSRRQEGSRR